MSGNGAAEERLKKAVELSSAADLCMRAAATIKRNPAGQIERIIGEYEPGIQLAFKAAGEYFSFSVAELEVVAESRRASAVGDFRRNLSEVQRLTEELFDIETGTIQESQAEEAGIDAPAGDDRDWIARLGAELMSGTVGSDDAIEAFLCSLTPATVRGSQIDRLDAFTRKVGECIMASAGGSNEAAPYQALGVMTARLFVQASQGNEDVIR